MKYIIAFIFSLIYCPFISVMIFALTFLKGLWGNGFYYWVREDSISLKEQYSHSDKAYFWEIFNWRYVSKWYNAGKWHDA